MFVSSPKTSHLDILLSTFVLLESGHFEPGASNYLRMAGDPFYLVIIRRTLAAGLAVSGLSLLIGYPVALSMVRMPARRRSLLLMLLLFPLMVSNVIRAYGWIAILGQRGLVNNLLRDVGLVPAPLPLLYSVETVVVGLLTILLPYMIICLVNALLTVDRTLEEAAQALGAGPLRTFLHVTLPLSTPGIASGLLCGWLFAFIVPFGELNTALFLTGPGVTTLPIEIFAYLQFQGSQLVIAAASTLQVCLVIVLVLTIERLIGLSSIIR